MTTEEKNQTLNKLFDTLDAEGLYDANGGYPVEKSTKKKVNRKAPVFAAMMAFFKAYKDKSKFFNADNSTVVWPQHETTVLFETIRFLSQGTKNVEEWRYSKGLDLLDRINTGCVGIAGRHYDEYFLARLRNLVVRAIDLLKTSL